MDTLVKSDQQNYHLFENKVSDLLFYNPGTNLSLNNTYYNAKHIF